jgi:tripeptide aminopeptidase
MKQHQTTPTTKVPFVQTMESERTWFEAKVLERFLRYVQVYTTSDPKSSTCPSTDRQWDLARILEQELKELGIESVQLTEYGYIIARVPASKGYEASPSIVFCSHMDTSPDSPGEAVTPTLWKNYDGSALDVGNGIRLDPQDNPALLGYVGETVITTNGSTLLGADDKAGIAEIMVGLEYLLTHPEIPRGPLEIVFTPDEEIGRGVDKLDVEGLSSVAGYTFDGSAEGTYNDQCFHAYTIGVTFTGRMIHPGTARGVMINAVSMAGAFIDALPRTESPEATDGTYGFYCPQEIQGRMDWAFFRLFIRDHSLDQIHRRIAFLESLAKTIEGAFPGSKVEVEVTKQYENLHPYVIKNPKIMEALIQGIRETGIEPIPELIRGGTDGARMSERGLPTPNIFAGGHNFHSTSEWIGLPALVRAAKTMVNIVRIWAEG